jgi:hypothetical protein
MFVVTQQCLFLKSVWMLIIAICCNAYDSIPSNMNHELLWFSSSSMDRNLNSVCDDGNQPMVHYFEVYLTIQPDLNNISSSNNNKSPICTLADQLKMGSDINALLSSHVSMQGGRQTDRQMYKID